MWCSKSIQSLLAILVSPVLFAQSPVVQQVVNTATSENRISPGVLADIVGANLIAQAGTTLTAGFAALRLDAAKVSPVVISNLLAAVATPRRATTAVSVTVGGRDAPVVEFSPQRLTVHIPLELQPGNSYVQVAAGELASTRFTINLDRYAPGLFRLRIGEPFGKFYSSTSPIFAIEKPVTPESPSLAGQEIQVEAVGLGQTQPPLETGTPAFGGARYLTIVKPTIRVGGIEALVKDAYLMPGTIGRYLVRFVVPSATPVGNQTVDLEIGAIRSNTVILPVGSGSGVTSCDYALRNNSTQVPVGGGTGSVEVLTGATCSWTATSSVPWITITTSQGVGPGTAGFRVAANEAPASRRATLTVAGLTYTIDQAGFGSASMTEVNIVNTFAGTDFTPPFQPVRATDLPIGIAIGMSVGPRGDIWIASGTLSLVFRASREGMGRVAAGNGFRKFSGEGVQATSAAFAFPSAVLEDEQGNVYIADAENHRVRKIAPNGVVTTVAGTGLPGFSGDGRPGPQAQLDTPTGLALNGAGVLFIADSANNRVRRLEPSGIISTVAGNGRREFCGDGGPAVQACLSDPKGMVLDKAGNLFIADRGNHRIRRMTPFGEISTAAGTGTAGFSGDGGLATQAMLNAPGGVAIDVLGNLYVAERYNHRVRRVASDGRISTYLGTGVRGFNGDGKPPAETAINEPLDVATDILGNVYVVDASNRRIRKVEMDGTVSTVVGNGEGRFSGDGDQAARAVLDVPLGLAVDAAGNIYVADAANHRVRRIARDGTIRTVAGTGQAGFGGDGGPAAQALLYLPQGLAVDAQGTLYIADRGNNRIRRVASNGTISTIAGNGRGGYADGGNQALFASLNDPSDVAVDRNGVVYVADTLNHLVRKILTNGTIFNVAGAPGQGGFTGDGGLAVLSRLFEPTGVTIDPADNILVADSGNNRVRRIDSAGRIQTLAGNGEGTFAGDGGPAVQASLNDPIKAVYDANGRLLIGDFSNQRLRVVRTDGIISTLAGNGRAGFSGDGGPATSAVLSFPSYLAIDAAGNVFLSDTTNNRVRVLVAERPAILAAPGALDFTATSGAARTEAQPLRLSGNFAGLQFTVAVATQAGGDWLNAGIGFGTLPATVMISVDPSELPPGKYEGMVRLAAPGANPPLIQIPVSVTVGPGLPANLEVEPSAISLSGTRGSGPITRRLRIRNAGGGPLLFEASQTPSPPVSWLTVAPASGRTIGGISVLIITVDPGSLEAGSYATAVTVYSPTTGQRVNVPVTFSISEDRAVIRLSQTGLPFTGVVGGGAIPPQKFEILNSGSGSLRWELRTTTLRGGDWLSVSQESGLSEAGGRGVPVTLNLTTTGLTEGEYYGQIEVVSADAGNQPQVVSVALNLLRAGTPLGPLVSPNGLAFTGVAGDSNPGSQELLVYNSSLSSVNFVLGAVTEGGRTWVNALPTQGTVNPSGPRRIQVQPDFSGLGPGVYRGAVTLIFSDNSYRLVPVLLILRPNAEPRATAIHSAAGACTPNSLVPLFTSVPQDFSLPVAWPVPVEVRVFDDCGNPMTEGAVQTAFSNGDAPLNLTSLRDGRWSATWFSRLAPVIPLVLTTDVEQTSPYLTGRASLSGGMRSNDTPPLVSREGVVSSSSFQASSSLAPGSLVSIFGVRLSDFQAVSAGASLETRLGGAEVILGGRRLPLIFATERQINALVPFDFPTNTDLPLIVRRGPVPSAPESVLISDAAPGIFIVNQDGIASALAYSVGEDGSLTQITPGQPARPGQTIMIQCSGLGRTSPEVPSTSASVPLGDFPTIHPAFVVLDDREITSAYSGLIPGAPAGVYQVRFKLPSDLAKGDVTLKLRSGRLVSPAAILRVAAAE